MPLFYNDILNNGTKIGVWNITEPESFFLNKVPLQREITHPHKRLQHLAGRYLLQHLFPDFPYHLIEIADTRRPFLPNEEYHFSISHCGDYAAVIISTDERVGIDIEMIMPKIERIKHKFLSEKELSIASLTTDNSQLTTESILTGLWSIKESLFKWIGEGGVDFKEHLHINKLEQGDDLIAHCEIDRNFKTELEVKLIYFDKTCLATVCKEVAKQQL
jgi:phosphopantetheinyl transferase